MGRTPQPFIEQSTVPKLLENPPTGLNKTVVQRDVGVFQVHPKTDAISQRLPFLDVAEYALAASLVKLFDTVLFNFPLGAEAQFLFDLQLHRQSVGIPATFADATIALHRSMAADDILKDPG